MVDPAIHKTIDVTFPSLGKGLYRATGLGTAFTSQTAAGIWHLFVEADGTSAAGRSFTRFATTGFDFSDLAPPVELPPRVLEMRRTGLL